MSLFLVFVPVFFDKMCNCWNISCNNIACIGLKLKSTFVDSDTFDKLNLSPIHQIGGWTDLWLPRFYPHILPQFLKSPELGLTSYGQCSHFIPQFYTMHKICQKTCFHWPVFSLIRTESRILTLYTRMRVSEKTRSGIF